MADNVTIPAQGTGTSTPVIATDDVSSVHFQKIKINLGGDGVDSGSMASGAGNVGSTVPRVTLAADDPAVASLGVIDDWDESDRAKVNLIVGQAGITGGAGSVAANTPRVTHASDDPVVVALQIMDDWDNGASDGASVSGDVAHDTADAGEPVKVGHKAIAHGSNPTAVTANDRTNWYANRHGIPFVLGGHPNSITLEAAYTSAQTNTAVVTISTGSKIVVTQALADCDNANTNDTGLRLGFATATTPTTTGVILTHPGIPKGGGVSRGNGAGIIGIGADDEDLRVTSEDPGGAVRVNVTYFTIES